MDTSTPSDPVTFLVEQGIKVAVKTLPQTSASQNELFILQELQGHPNIIKLQKFENTDEHLRIYMDYHPQCLLDLFEEHPDGLPLSQVRYIFEQLVTTLNYIHKHGYIHHDVKLENILIDSKGSIYLIDFGHSYPWTPGGLNQASRLGSIHYAAPEIWLQKPFVGPEVDVWAAGVCLFMLVTGFFPFGGTTEQQVWEEIQIKELWKNEALEKDSALFDLLQRMLEFERDQRISLDGVRAHPWMDESIEAEITSLINRMIWHL